MSPIIKKNNYSIYKLCLASIHDIFISSQDKEAEQILVKIAKIMQLNKIDNSNFIKTNITIKSVPTLKSTIFKIPSEIKNSFSCVLSLVPDRSNLFLNLMKFSFLLELYTISNGGFLIHGALAEWDGNGIVLAASSGGGKTTASNRLPPTWNSHSDDITLIIKDHFGNYFAHPWPTWSRCLDRDFKETWNIQKYLSIKAIFFLSHDNKNYVEPLNSVQAASYIAKSTKQVSPLMFSLKMDDRIKINLEKFNNICGLVKIMRINLLHLSLDGKFWEKIENVI